MKKIMHVVFILVLLAVIGVGVYRYTEYKKYEPLRNDYERIATADYTSVFFSTFPVTNYTEEDFATYREVYALKSSYCIPDMETLNEYFTLVTQNGREITSIYLGVRPDIMSADELLNLVNTWYGVPFEVIIAYPSLEYWQELDEEEYTATLTAYQDFINTLMPYYEDDPWIQGNLGLYFYGDTQWLVGNPCNYESDFNVNAGISHSLSMYSDRNHEYILTLDNYEERLENFETLVSECRENKEQNTEKENEYPDLSKWDVVFFGDSITAFEETSSIPGAFAGITGAHTYNCAQGGTSAADRSAKTPGISTVVNRFIAEDASAFAEDTLTYKGITDYLDNSKKKRQKCFVINFGMNDYFSGYPVRSEEDPYDTTTYEGSLRTAIENLQAAYPDAMIILMTPNFTNYFGNGLEPQSDEGSILLDYVAAMDNLSTTYDLPLYNSYTELGIDGTNHTEYLQDGCHPKENTRYTMAQGLAELVQKQLAAEE
ncbi:MAG: SGNH/GDSL hydrolase family protein [Lachnospiraceae bacterium]|nr:SGNH/GDSL hydrolase family protein [Lachnospiraceae bacterium]